MTQSVIWSPIPGGITTPSGFQAAGITAGLKASGKPDLSLLLAPKDAVCAGTFTTSVVRAGCVDLCAERLQDASGVVRAVLTNSGQANACTGDRGRVDSVRATQVVGDLLGLSEDQVLICSTGVIGVPIAMDILLPALDPLVTLLSPDGGAAAAQAILTTDLVEKQIAFEAELGGRRVRLGGMAKGSGMIHPDMATMLGYLTCDVAVPASIWQSIVSRAVERSFNAITVDGDTSTNDTFLAFAAGEPLSSDQFEALEHGVTLVAQHLARAIARERREGGPALARRAETCMWICGLSRGCAGPASSALMKIESRGHHALARPNRRAPRHFYNVIYCDICIIYNYRCSLASTWVK